MFTYILFFSNAASRALKRLPVKTEEDLKKQQHRLLLFKTTKSILKQGMVILGLKPLNKM